MNDEEQQRLVKEEIRRRRILESERRRQEKIRSRVEEQDAVSQPEKRAQSSAPTRSSARLTVEAQRKEENRRLLAEHWAKRVKKLNAADATKREEMRPLKPPSQPQPAAARVTRKKQAAETSEDLHAARRLILQRQKETPATVHHRRSGISVLVSVNDSTDGTQGTADSEEGDAAARPDPEEEEEGESARIQRNILNAKKRKNQPPQTQKSPPYKKTATQNRVAAQPRGVRVETASELVARSYNWEHAVPHNVLQEIDLQNEYVDAHGNLRERATHRTLAANRNLEDLLDERQRDKWARSKEAYEKSRRK